jgi:hypothetical protein
MGDPEGHRNLKWGSKPSKMLKNILQTEYRYYQPILIVASSVIHISISFFSPPNIVCGSGFFIILALIFHYPKLTRGYRSAGLRAHTSSS